MIKLCLVMCLVALSVNQVQNCEPIDGFCLLDRQTSMTYDISTINVKMTSEPYMTYLLQAGPSQYFDYAEIWNNGMWDRIYFARSWIVIITKNDAGVIKNYIMPDALDVIVGGSCESYHLYEKLPLGSVKYGNSHKPCRYSGSDYAEPDCVDSIEITFPEPVWIVGLSDKEGLGLACHGDNIVSWDFWLSYSCSSATVLEIDQTDTFNGGLEVTITVKGDLKNRPVVVEGCPVWEERVIEQDWHVEMVRRLTVEDIKDCASETEVINDNEKEYSFYVGVEVGDDYFAQNWKLNFNSVIKLDGTEGVFLYQEKDFTVWTNMDDLVRSTCDFQSEYNRKEVLIPGPICLHGIYGGELVEHFACLSKTQEISETECVPVAMKVVGREGNTHHIQVTISQDDITEMGRAWGLYDYLYMKFKDPSARRIVEKVMKFGDRRNEDPVDPYGKVTITLTQGFDLRESASGWTIPVIVVLAAIVAALACVIFGGFTFFVTCQCRRSQKKRNMVQPTVCDERNTKEEVELEKVELEKV